MLSFLHTALLPWLAVIAVPLAIHLLTRRTRRRMDLPTVRFVQRTLANQSRIFRWRHLILLLLRMLAVAALVLAFARPSLNSLLAAPGHERAGAVVLLDVSESMGYSAGGVTSLAKAKGDALRALEGLRPGDKANVVLCAAQPAAVFNEPTEDLAAVQNAVRTAQATEQRGDPAAALNLAVEQLAKTNARARRLLIFSDFQRTNWADTRFDVVPADTRILFASSDSGPRSNVGISSLRLRPATPRVGETVTASCEVFNSGGAMRVLPLTITLSNGSRQTEQVSLAPYSSATVNFPFFFDAPQRIEATATIPGDDLTLDDTRRLVIDLQQMAVVVLITDEDTNAPPAASYFLTRALRPNPSSNAGFRVIPVRPASLNNPLLQSADVVIVCDAPGMPEVQYQALARYMLGGGSLVWFLYGDRTEEQVRGVARHLPAAEPWPVPVEGETDVQGKGKGYVTLSEARYESPLLRAFKDPAAADLSRIRFRRFYLTGEVEPRAETLLKFEDGTAAAVRSGEGSGSLLVLNVAPSPSWSDLARQEVFLPLLHEFLKGLLLKDVSLRESYPGGSASASLPPASPGEAARAPAKARVTCSGPDGGSLPAIADPASGSVVIEQVKRTGFYRLSAAGQPMATIAVNPHPDETDLRSIDPRELETRRQAGVSYLAGMSGTEVDDLTRARPLWQYFLLAALLFMFAEQAVSQLRPRRRQ